MRNTIQSRPSVSTIENLSTQSSYLLNQPRNSASMLVVIDPRVEDYAMLAAGVHEGANVFILDLNRDGVEQITEALAQHPASTLHIVSHGSPGCLAVGNTYLSLENLDRYADDLQTWSIFLSSASVFLYACNVAAGELGEAFLSKLHQLTGANIAASANPTGSALKGGDWELEVIIGKIEASLAFPEVVREAYTSVLVISITPLTGISLTEGGDSQTLAVGIDLGIDPVLNTPIATLADATITLTPDAQLDLGNGAGNPFNVIIPAGSTAATITNVAVRGVNDNVTEGNHTGTITATITSTNPILNALPGVNLTTTISDPSLPPAPVPLISITPLTGISLTEGGDSQTLAVGIDLGIDPVLNTPIATLADA
ncbi:MAG: DUF4347 domain-containing protein, partial [Hassallia sp. WJT32-NPBG1]|nr:DUF4347 domain-containing protein [Hassallia sp. WJT32-NPBG1]